MCPVPCHESRMLSLKVCSTDLLGQPLSSSLLCLLSDLHLQHQRPLHPSLPGPVGCGKLASRISSFQIKLGQGDTLPGRSADPQTLCFGK
jgi:hypothetical protein